MIRLSSGLRAAMLWDAGLRAMMWRGTIHIYTGTQPASADMAPTGTLIGRITEDGAGFVAGAISGGLRTKAKTLTSIQDDGNWVVKGVTTGQPGWWRFKWNGLDTDDDDLYSPRIDGTVGESLFNLPEQLFATTEIQNVEFNFYFLGN
jgi:hypothetical protein